MLGFRTLRGGWGYGGEGQQPLQVCARRRDVLPCTSRLVGQEDAAALVSQGGAGSGVA